MKERYLIVAWPSDHDEDINGHAQDIQDALVDMGAPVIVTDLGSDLTQVLTDHLEGDPQVRRVDGETWASFIGFRRPDEVWWAVLKPGYVWVDSARDLDGAIKFACEREGLPEPWNSVETLNRLRSLPAYCEIVTSPVLRSLWEARLVKKDRGFV